MEEDPEEYLFGLIIRQGRADWGLSQEQFAERIGVDPRTVQRWERGECIPWPTFVAKIIDLAPEIGVSLQRAIKKNLRMSIILIKSSNVNNINTMYRILSGKIGKVCH